MDYRLLIKSEANPCVDSAPPKCKMVLVCEGSGLVVLWPTTLVLVVPLPPSPGLAVCVCWCLARWAFCRNFFEQTLNYNKEVTMGNFFMRNRENKKHTCLKIIQWKKRRLISWPVLRRSGSLGSSTVYKSVRNANEYSHSLWGNSFNYHTIWRKEMYFSPL